MKMEFLKNINLGKYLFALLIILAVSFLVFNEKGILSYLEIKNEVSSIEDKIQDVEAKQKKVDNQIDSLQYNDAKIEEVARKKYRMKRKGEKLIEVIEK
ncbi:MAG: septum formation initiator family protein [Melioribacteraceae bacterium]|nr:septum formation initiator family protein [Melioribacteraceae bacterium]